MDWRRATVERSDLSRFLFGPEDVIVAVGQDGLVVALTRNAAPTAPRASWTPTTGS